MIDFTLVEFLIVGAILAGASFIQGTVGFASGLFGVPLLVMANRSLPEAITITLMAAVVQNAMGIYRLRRKIDFHSTVQPTIIRFFALPAGTVVLYLVNEAVDQDQIKQIVGVALLTMVTIYGLWRVKPRRELHPGWSYLSFGTSGLMAGFCGMGGPPMVLWVMSHRWSSAKSRGFLFVVFLTGLVPHFGTLLVIYGTELLAGAILGLLSVPLVVLATFAGLHLGKMLPRPQLRKLTFAVLVLVAISAIVWPYIKMTPAGG